MSYQMQEACKPVQCSLTAKSILMWLAYHHNSESGRCDPSVELLAKEACMTTRSVGNALKELKESGHINCDRAPGRRYRFTLNPRTTFTPEGDSPPKEIPVTPEGDSGNPRTTFRLPPNHVPINSKERKENRKKKVKVTPPELFQTELEPPYQSPEFRQTWQEWVLHRKEIRKPLTESAIRLQFADFLKWGEQQSIENIQISIKSGYQGIFAAKHNPNTNQKPTKNPTDLTVYKPL